MRLLFLFALFLNIAFFAWSRYFSPPDAGTDPLPHGRQIEPDRLKLIAPADAPPPAAAKPVPQAAPGAQPSALQGACLEWGSFTLADAPRAEKALESLALGERVGQRRTEEAAGWWVYIPSPGSRQAALKKAAELKALGVEEFFVVAEDTQFRWAVSLGVFRNEEAAQARLVALRNRGVKSAQVGPRETTVPKVWLQVKGIDPALEERLRAVAKDVEGSELRPCL